MGVAASSSSSPERAPLLDGGGAVPRAALATTARTMVLAYMVLHSLALGLFVALRETYTAKVLDASDPVATATWAVAAFYVGHAVSMPILGKLSDGVGRRPLMLVGISAIGAAFAVIAATSSPWVFVACFGGVGVLDAAHTMMTLALVDTSAAPLGDGLLGRLALRFVPSLRASEEDASTGRQHDTDTDASGGEAALVERRIGVLFSAAWTTGLVGTVLGVGGAPVVAAGLSIRGALAAVAGVYAVLFVLVAARMPETAPSVSLSSASSSSSSEQPATHWCALLGAAVRDQRRGAALLFGTPRRRLLLAANFLVHVAAAGAFSLIMYWAVFKFGLGVAAQAAIGLLGLGVVGTAVVALQTVGIPGEDDDDDDGPPPPTTTTTRRSSERACAECILAAAPFWVVLGVAVEAWMAFVGALAVAAVAVFPELRALLTADLARRDQGYVQGALASVNAVADIVGAVGLLLLFEQTVDDDVPHDSHRSRGSFVANATWHAALALQLVAVALLYATPPVEPPLEKRRRPRTTTTDVMGAEKNATVAVAVDDHQDDDDDDDEALATHLGDVIKV